MDKILVHGGNQLAGSIKISGSKNSALPILAATLLTREPCTIHRVPDLSDTHYMLQILTHLGAQVERASGTVNVMAENVDSVAPYDVVRRMRASVCVLGPLLGRLRWYFPGYSVDFIGSLIGCAYMLALGWTAGQSIAFVYNRAVARAEA